VGVSALWEKWFVSDLKILPDNPWAEIEPPKFDKLPVRYATDEMIGTSTSGSGVGSATGRSRGCSSRPRRLRDVG
jgi:hypothetical protein